MCTKQTSTLPDCAHEQFRYWYINWRGAHIWSVICINKQTVYIVIQFLYPPCIPNSTGQRNFKNQNLNPITELFRKFDHHLGRLPHIRVLFLVYSYTNSNHHKVLHRFQWVSQLFWIHRRCQGHTAQFPCRSQQRLPEFLGAEMVISWKPLAGRVDRLRGAHPTISHMKGWFTL